MLELGDNIHFTGYITGPPDTPYEGGKFAISIELPDKYPFKPPKMAFETKIWHPNVSSQVLLLFTYFIYDRLDVFALIS